MATMNLWGGRVAAVGDMVMYDDGRPRVSRVAKIGARSATLEDKTRWTRQGRMFGTGRDAWSGSVFLDAYDEARFEAWQEKYERHRLASELNGVDWRKLPTQTLRAVRAIVDGAEG